MKIQFQNNSVSGVNRKYRGFVLDLPGHSSQAIDVPPQYVKDVLSYLKYRHPAVICTPVAEKLESSPNETNTVASAVQIEAAGEETGATDTTAESDAVTGSGEDETDTEGQEEKVPAVDAGAGKKTKKSGGKK